MTNEPLTDDYIRTDLVIEYLEQLDPETHKTYYYSVNDFYNDKKVKPAINKLLALRTAKDYTEILTKLQAKPTALLKYYKTIMSDGQLQLKKEVYRRPSTSQTQELASKYTKASGQRQAPMPYNSLRQLLYGKMQPDDAETKTVTDYAITDYEALGSELLKAEKLTIERYSLEKTNPKTIKTTFNGVDINISDIKHEARKLATNLGLDDSEYKKAQGVLWSFTLDGILANILGVILDGGKPKSKTYYTPPNIREDTSINYVPKPPIEAINKTLIMLANDPDTDKTMTKMYTSEQDRQRNNGLPVTIDKYDQQALFDSFTQKGIKNINRLVDLATNLTLPTFYMINQHLLENQRANSSRIEDLIIPEMSLQDFMRINPRFNTDKMRKKGIPSTDKQTTLNTLELLQKVQYPFTTVVKKDGKTVGYEQGSVKVFDYLIYTDAKTKKTTIKNLQYSRDYLYKFKTTIAIPYGEGFYLLTELAHQELDIAIQLILTSKENIQRTKEGLPSEIHISEFNKNNKIYKNYSSTNYYKTLTRGLDNLVKRKEIGNWHTKSGGQTITNQDANSQILYIYPTDIHKALITSDERKVIKQEQTRRLRDLKSLITLYRKDLRANKTSSLAYLDYLSEDLHITKDELQTTLAGGKPISDELMQEINILYNDYQK